MRKARFVWIILLVLMLSGCAKNEGMYVEPAQLTQEEQEIAELLGLNTEHRIFDFTVDDTVQTVQVNVYELDFWWGRPGLFRLHIGAARLGL